LNSQRNKATEETARAKVFPINLVAFALWAMPRWALSLFCRFLGALIPLVAPKRQALMMDNLRKSFPDETEKSLLLTAAKSRARTVELGLFSFALPLLSERYLRKSFPLSDKLKKAMGRDQEGGVLFLAPHLCLVESFCCLPMLLHECKEMSTVFRPLRNRRLGEWLRRGRERFGLRTLDRSRGLLQGARFLQKEKILTILFDQNAGHAGTRMKFLGRECSCTTLPDLLHERFHSNVVIGYVRRTGFWRAELDCEIIQVDAEKESVVEKANAWLEGKLHEDEDLRASWLWLHNRWKAGSGKPRKQEDSSA